MPYDTPNEVSTAPEKDTRQPGPLRKQADQLLSSPNARARDTSKRQHQVAQGECLWTIAKHQLETDRKSADGHAVRLEVDRIISINKEEFPNIASKPHTIKPGWNLRLVDEDDQPSFCKGQWHRAPEGQITVVDKGQCYIGTGDATLLVKGGGAAVLMDNNRALLEPNGVIHRALPGTKTLATGGQVLNAEPGARIRVMKPDATVNWIEPAKPFVPRPSNSISTPDRVRISPIELPVEPPIRLPEHIRISPVELPTSPPIKIPDNVRVSPIELPTDAPIRKGRPNPENLFIVLRDPQ